MDYWRNASGGIRVRHPPASRVTRRSLLQAALALAAGTAVADAPAAAVPIIDSHIHLFDPNRPQGAPYAGPAGSSTRQTGAFPEAYAALARPLGIVGALEIEASPWIEDNLWALEVAARSGFVVGKVGNLKPDAQDFAELLERFARNPLFRGIRYGNLWGYDLARGAASREFLDGLRRLARADLVLETANPTVSLLEAVVRISDAVPDLRIMIDHLPAFEPPPSAMADYERTLRALGERQTIYCKLSAVLHRVDGQVRKDLASHAARLDRLYETFGADRVLFGSDWPNSDGTAELVDIVRFAREYFAAKPRDAQEKFFWRNSLRAYKWARRLPEQPS
jgi:predicted TIM-barrel fold metal-dependent hydrolase